MQRLLIQQALCTLVSGSKFYQVFYTPGSGAPITYDPNTAPNVLPDSVRVNELSASYRLDKEYGGNLVLKKDAWTFVLFLEWSNKEVDLDVFEQSLMDSPPFIAATAQYRSVRLFLLKMDVSHPVQQDAATGTQAKFLFQAELGRA